MVARQGDLTMRIAISTLTIGLGALVGSGPALAQAPAGEKAATATAAEPPKPAAELDQLKFFIGSWKCEGKQFASAMSPTEHPVKATARVKWELGNRWQTFVYEEKKTKEHPMAVKVLGSWGYSAGGKHFVRADIDGFGGWFSPTSTGWEGDRFVWSGNVENPMGGAMAAKHTFTRKSDKEFVHSLELTAGGKASPIFEIGCKK
jgi:Protein of unknown function (DUF1579)